MYFKLQNNDIGTNGLDMIDNVLDPMNAADSSNFGTDGGPGSAVDDNVFMSHIAHAIMSADLSLSDLDNLLEMGDVGRFDNLVDPFERVDDVHLLGGGLDQVGGGIDGGGDDDPSLSDELAIDAIQKQLMDFVPSAMDDALSSLNISMCHPSTSTLPVVKKSGLGYKDSGSMFNGGGRNSDEAMNDAWKLLNPFSPSASMQQQGAMASIISDNVAQNNLVQSIIAQNSVQFEGAQRSAAEPTNKSAQILQRSQSHSGQALQDSGRLQNFQGIVDMNSIIGMSHLFSKTY